MPKQPAFDLGAETAPEIDFDRRRLDIVEGLPEFIPEPIDELLELAKVFATTFGYLKNPEKIRKAAPVFAEVLGGMRKSRIAVAVAWAAFRDAVIAREGQPLVGGLPKTAWAYLPNGRAQTPPGPRFDTCTPGCPLPPGVFLPRLQKGDTAHWDGDEWIYGSRTDPGARR